MKQNKASGIFFSSPVTSAEIDNFLPHIKANLHKSFQKDSPTYQTLLKTEIYKKIEDATKIIEDIYKNIGNGGGISIGDIQESILPTIKQAAEIPNIYHLFNELNSKDEYTYRHTISVGIIATLLGKWLGLSPKELSVLTLGATLHDIGKAKIPSQILNKPGKLTREEYEEMKLHTIYGYEILKEIKTIDERVALMALQHHEREDGKGYPLGLVKNQANPLAKIVAIADVFHAMASPRVYHQESPFYVVMRQMQNDVFGKFDPAVMLVFLNKLMNTLIGKNVELSDGSQAKILMINPYDPLRCLVKIDDKLIDLRSHYHLNIERILEED